MTDTPATSRRTRLQANRRDGPVWSALPGGCEQSESDGASCPYLYRWFASPPTPVHPAPVQRMLAPDGSVLTLADLPPPGAQRWVASRKAIIVAAVRGGLLSMSDACARYRLTTEEFLNWQAQVDRNSLQGLRTTRVQEYRGTGRRTHGHHA